MPHHHHTYHNKYYLSLFIYLLVNPYYTIKRLEIITPGKNTAYFTIGNNKGIPNIISYSYQRKLF